MAVRKLFSYPGGKWPIRKQVVAAFPKHTTYVDVFGGSATILLTKDRSQGEVFNDKNGEIVNFFRVVKHRPAELAEEASHWLHSRKMWRDLLESERPLDEIARAFRFWAVLDDSFGARGKHFGTTRKGVHSVTHARAYLAEVSERLKDVHIECLDAKECIRVYDSPQTFFYCDPPYPGTKGGDSNYAQLTDDEWKSLRETLRAIEGKFLLSCNPHPMVLGLFKGCRTAEISVRETLSVAEKSKMRQEVLISNYALPTVTAGRMVCAK